MGKLMPNGRPDQRSEPRARCSWPLRESVPQLSPSRNKGPRMACDSHFSSIRGIRIFPAGFIGMSRIEFSLTVHGTKE